MTLALGASVSPLTITQGADRWPEVPTVADAVFYLDVRDPGSGTATILYQTAPRREDASFATMLSVPITPTTTTRADAVLGASAPIPMAKYLRWQLGFIGADSVTFRLWMATYSLG